MIHRPARDHRQAHDQGVGVLASVGLDVANDEVAACGRFTPRRFEHGVGLPHARAHAEKDLEASALCPRRLVMDGCQQRVGIGTVTFGHGASLANF